MNNIIIGWGRRCAAIAVTLCALCATITGHATGVTYSDALDRLGLGHYVQGGILPNGSVTDWWYGCSPTAAGMIMGYYDRNGYAGKAYDNLVAGGQAELNVVGNNGPYGGDAPLLKQAIASRGHQGDFYSADDNINGYHYNTGDNPSYMTGGDDKPTSRPFDSLADFMGTSQDAIGNVNGSTTFYYFTDGTRFTALDAWNYNVWDADGMFGIAEYVYNQGYAVDINQIYTQKSANNPLMSGFTFDQYKAEIDAGRPVMIQVNGHSMMGFGYEPGTTTIDMRNTWDNGIATMDWGGSYRGMDMWGVTAFTVQGGTPAPDAGATLLLLSFGFSGLLIFRRRV